MGNCSTRAAQSDFKLQPNVKTQCGNCSLAALSLTDNCKFLLLKSKVYLLSEYILLKAPMLSLDNLRRKVNVTRQESKSEELEWKK